MMTWPAGLSRPLPAGLSHAVAAAGCAAIEALRLPPLHVQAELGGIVAVAVNGIKEALVGTECEGRGVGQVRNMLQVGPGTRWQRRCG